MPKAAAAVNGLAQLKKQVRKNSKTESTNGTAAAAPASSGEVTPVETAVPSTKKPAKAAKKSSRKVAAKKAPAKSAAKKSAPPKQVAVPKVAEPTDAEIRLRAYFIAERRAQQSLHGDPANDWLEARKQLREEAGLD